MKKNKMFGVLLVGSLLSGSFGEVRSMDIVSATAIATASAIAPVTSSAASIAVSIVSLGLAGILSFGALGIVCYDMHYWNIRGADQPQQETVAPSPPPAMPVPPLKMLLLVGEAYLSDDESDNEDGSFSADAEALRPDEPIY
jgi:hypothetical protein